MPQKGKISPDEKLEIVKRCISGEIGQNEASRLAGVNEYSIRVWISLYRAEGASAFVSQERDRIYSPELKQLAVENYLSGVGSLQKICEKYKIRSTRQLRKWIQVYNRHEDFKAHTGGSRMTKARKTTQEERLTIAGECLGSGKNYGEIALKYNVSYQQVYTWVKKFSELGEVGLEDRRGQRTLQQEARTQEEELRIRVAQLEHENYLLRMERDLLKKVKEYERRDAFHK